MSGIQVENQPVPILSNGRQREDLRLYFFLQIEHHAHDPGPILSDPHLRDVGIIRLNLGDQTLQLGIEFDALDLDDDCNEVVHVSGVPRATDLSDVVPSQWIIFYPRLVHPELRGWFRERYDAAVAALPSYRRTSHDKYRHHKWQALFDSTPPDRWSSDDEP